MIDIKTKTLGNGLRVIVHEDPLAPIATFNVLYNVGSRHESPERTGFAHLFEHLMFGGSANVPDFDYEVQRVGGDTNAFTTPDFTNYFISLPADNIETAFWLESDRLLAPAFSQEGLDVQKKVVVEEFRQRYLNRPYGDCQHLFRDLIYKVHPYRWPTIGLKVEHIQDATLAEVESFFYSHYIPRNAVVAIVGNVDANRMFDLAEKWFGDIRREAPDTIVPAEPLQTETRILDVTADVPASRVSIAFHMAGKDTPDFFRADLLTDVLADGSSSRFERRLVRELQSCTDANAYIEGSFDPGYLALTATVADGVSPETVLDQLWHEAELLISEPPAERELQKSFNRQNAAQVFGLTNPQGLAQSLAYYALAYGDPNRINDISLEYQKVSPEDISTFARETFCRQKANTFIYRAKN